MFLLCFLQSLKPLARAGLSHKIQEKVLHTWESGMSLTQLTGGLFVTPNLQHFSPKTPQELGDNSKPH